MGNVISDTESMERKVEEFHSNLESSTGEMFEITCRRYGTNYSLVVGDLNSRKARVEVYDTKPEFDFLKGEYSNIEDLRTDLAEKERPFRKFSLSNKDFTLYESTDNTSSVNLVTHVGKWRFLSK